MLRGLGRAGQHSYTRAMVAEHAIKHDTAIVEIFAQLTKNKASYNAETAAAFVKASYVYGLDKVLPHAERYGTQMWATVDCPLKRLHDEIVRFNKNGLKIRMRGTYARVVTILRALLEGRSCKRAVEATEDFPSAPTAR